MKLSNICDTPQFATTLGSWHAAIYSTFDYEYFTISGDGSYSEHYKWTKLTKLLDRGPEKIKIFTDNLASKTGIVWTANTKARMVKAMTKESNIFYDERKELLCINNGDVFIWDDPPKFIFNARTFSINNDEGDYMKDMNTSKSGHVLFLTSNGDIFSFGMNNKEQCGVNNDNTGIKQIEEYDNQLCCVNYVF